MEIETPFSDTEETPVTVHLRTYLGVYYYYHDGKTQGNKFQKDYLRIIKNPK